MFLEAGAKNPNPRKRKKQQLKMGHGGTLDSAASGVLGKWAAPGCQVYSLTLVLHLGPVSTRSHISLSVVTSRTPCDNSSGRKGWQIRGYYTWGSLLQVTGKYPQRNVYEMCVLCGSGD